MCPTRPVVVRVCTKTGVIFESPLAGERGDSLSLFLVGVPPSVYHKEVQAVGDASMSIHSGRVIRASRHDLGQFAPLELAHGAWGCIQ